MKQTAVDRQAFNLKLDLGALSIPETPLSQAISPPLPTLAPHFVDFEHVPGSGFATVRRMVSPSDLPRQFVPPSSKIRSLNGILESGDQLGGIIHGSRQEPGNFDSWTPLSNSAALHPTQDVQPGQLGFSDMGLGIQGTGAGGDTIITLGNEAGIAGLGTNSLSPVPFLILLSDVSGFATGMSSQGEHSGIHHQTMGLGLATDQSHVENNVHFGGGGDGFHLSQSPYTLFRGSEDSGSGSDSSTHNNHHHGNGGDRLNPANTRSILPQTSSPVRLDVAFPNQESSGSQGGGDNGSAQASSPRAPSNSGSGKSRHSSPTPDDHRGNNSSIQFSFPNSGDAGAGSLFFRSLVDGFSLLTIEETVAGFSLLIFYSEVSLHGTFVQLTENLENNTAHSPVHSGGDDSASDTHSTGVSQVESRQVPITVSLALVLLNVRFEDFRLLGCGIGLGPCRFGDEGLKGWSGDDGTTPGVVASPKDQLPREDLEYVVDSPLVEGARQRSFSPQGAGLLGNALSIDLLSLEKSVQQFFDQIDRLEDAGAAASPLSRLPSWVLALAVAGAAVEIARRQLNVSVPVPRLTARRAARTWTWFSGAAPSPFEGQR